MRLVVIGLAAGLWVTGVWILFKAKEKRRKNVGSVLMVVGVLLGITVPVVDWQRFLDRMHPSKPQILSNEDKAFSSTATDEDK